MGNQYSKERGVHFDYEFEGQPELMKSPDVDSKECKIFSDEREKYSDPILKEHYKKCAKVVCACGNTEFSIYQLGFTTIAKCNNCENEKDVHEG